MFENLFNKDKNLLARYDNLNPNTNNLFEAQNSAPKTFSDMGWGEKLQAISKPLKRYGAELGVLGNTGQRFEPLLKQYQHEDELEQREALFNQRQNNAARTDTNKMRDVEYLMNMGLPQDEAIERVFGKDPQTVVNVGGDKLSPFDEVYQKEAAKQLVKGQTDLTELTGSTDSALVKIDDMIKTIGENPDIVGPYAKFKEIGGSYTGGKVGFSPEELGSRGEISRMLGSAKNELIAEAKSQGQSGINTAREIEMATAGLNENATAEQIIGALKVMKKARSDLAKIKSDRINRQLSQYGEQFGSRYEASNNGFGQTPINNIQIDRNDPKVQEALAQGYTLEEIQQYLGR